MARRAYSDVAGDLTSAVQSTSPSVDTKQGTFARDVIIDPPALEFDSLYAETERVGQAQSPETADDQGLLMLASNLGLERGRTQKATGRVFFYRSTAPGEDITIPAGTRVGTQSTTDQSALWFTTLATVTMSASLASGYYNATRSRYEIPASVVAVGGGTDYNVAIATVISIQTAITGIDGVTNEEDMDGGEEQETFDSLQERIVARIAGNNVGTKDGLSTLVETNAYVSGVKVVGPGEAEMTRTSAGGVDIYVRGLSQAAVRDVYVYSAALPHSMDYQPVVTTASGSITGSESGILEYGTDWIWAKASGSYGGSYLAADSIEWVTSPVEGEQLTVGYLYNKLIWELQVLVDREDNKLVCADVLVKWATQVAINVGMSISILPGFDSTTVSGEVSSAISTALSAYALGADVQQSDLIAIAHAVAGVDDVRVPLDTFETADDSIAQDTAGNLPIPSTSYAVVGTIGITVV